MLADHPSDINERDLRQLAREGDEWWLSKTVSSNSATLEETPILALDPVEQVEDGIGRIHADVVAQLLDRLHSQQPAFFEQAVLDLLIAMGTAEPRAMPPGHSCRTTAASTESWTRTRSG